MISIRQPLYFSEIGKKANQEDSVYPAFLSSKSRVFLLCDGMGGHDYGEVASQTVANSMGYYLSSCSSVDIPTFQTALSKGYHALDINPDLTGDTKGTPGTTMTCLCINPDNYLVAHIGDSRIYHIRPSRFNPDTRSGGILYQSSDHSLVNDLLKAGEITEQEARDFPQKNVITRAMQPAPEKRHKADVFVFDDIRAGDYFFFCSDGVMELLYADTLCEILANKKLNDEEKLRAIRIICGSGTKDNYTCWLIPIDKVDILHHAPVSDVIMAEADDEPAPRKNSFFSRLFTPKLRKSLSIVGYSLLAVVFVYVLYRLIKILVDTAAQSPF